jgi:hypothetical protein
VERRETFVQEFRRVPLSFDEKRIVEIQAHVDSGDDREVCRREALKAQAKLV